MGASKNIETMRKRYKINDWVEWSVLSEIVKKIESKHSHIHCRINIHTKEFEMVSKDVKKGLPVIDVHDMCRPIWDEKFYHETKS